MTSPVIRLSHVALRTPDVDRLRTYYTEVIGLSPYDEDAGAVFLASGGDGPALELRSQPTPGLDHVGFEISAPYEEELLSRPSGQGIDVLSRDAPEPGFSRVHEIRDGEGNAPQLCVVDQSRAAVPRSTTGVVPNKIGHIASRTRSRRSADRVLRIRARLSLVGLDGRLLRVPALQHRSPHGQLRQRLPARRAASLRLRTHRRRRTTDGM